MCLTFYPPVKEAKYGQVKKKHKNDGAVSVLYLSLHLLLLCCQLTCLPEQLVVDLLQILQGRFFALEFGLQLYSFLSGDPNSEKPTPQRL